MKIKLLCPVAQTVPFYKAFSSYVIETLSVVACEERSLYVSSNA